MPTDPFAGQRADHRCPSRHFSSAVGNEEDVCRCQSSLFVGSPLLFHRLHHPFYLLRPQCRTIPFYHCCSNIFSPVGPSITIFYATELDGRICITLIHSVQYKGKDSRLLLLSFAWCGSFTHIYVAVCTTHIIMISIGFTCCFNSIATYLLYPDSVPPR